MKRHKIILVVAAMAASLCSVHLYAQTQGSPPKYGPLGAVSSHGIGTWDGITELVSPRESQVTPGLGSNSGDEFDLFLHIRLLSTNQDQEGTIAIIRGWLSSNSASGYKGIGTFLSSAQLGIPSTALSALARIANLDSGVPSGWFVHAGTDRNIGQSPYAYVDVIYPVSLTLGGYSIADVDTYLDSTLAANGSAPTPTPNGGSYANGLSCLKSNTITDPSARNILGLPQ
jgi:hypothetical protein